MSRVSPIFETLTVFLLRCFFQKTSVGKDAQLCAASLSIPTTPYSVKMNFIRISIPKRKFFTVALTISGLFVMNNAFAQRFAVASGNWNGAIWASTVNGTAGSATAPTATDAVTINGGVTVTVNITNAACSSLSINPSDNQTTGTLTFNANSTLSADNIIIGGNGNSIGALNMTTGGTLKTTGTITTNGSNTVFTAGTGTIDYTYSGTQTIAALSYNNLTISGSGTKSFGAGIFTIAGTFSKTAGSMDAGTSTIIFTGASGSISGSGAKDFYNLQINSGATISATAGSITINNSFLNNGTFAQTAGLSTSFKNMQTLTGSGTTTFGDLTVMSNSTLNAGTHSFTVDGGSFSVSSLGTFNGGNATVSFSGSSSIGNGAGTAINFNNIAINSTATLSNKTNNKNFNVLGNWTNSGTYTAGTETITFNGSAGQTLTGATTFSNLTVNNAAGLTIANNITVNSALTFISGKVTTGSNKVIVSGTVGGTGLGTLGWVAGNLQKTISASNVTQTFQIGDASNYRPVSVNFTNVTTTGGLVVAVTQSAGEHPSVATSGIDQAKDINRYFSLTPSGLAATGNYTVTLNFVSADVDAGATPTNFVARRYNGTSWSTPTVQNASAASIQALPSQLSATNEFVVGECFTPNVSNFSVSATTTCNGNGAAVTIVSSSLANGTYDVTYTLSGVNTGSTTKIVVISSGSGTLNTDPLTNSGSTTITINSIAVSNSLACPSTPNSGNSANFSVSSTNTWTGATSGDWSTAGNWGCAFLPSSNYDVVISSSTPNNPTLSTGTGSVRNLTINSGAILTIGGTLQIAGVISNSGTLTASSGTIEFNGNNAQSLPASTFSGNTVQNLIISNNVGLNGPLSLTGALSFGNVNSKVFTTNDNLTLKSTSSATARVADLTNGGNNTSNSISGNVTVERYIPDLGSRRYRLLTSPVTGTTINDAWQEGQTWNGSSSLNGSGYGTLISGETPADASTANNSGFDFWSATVRSSVRKYVQGTTNTVASFTPLSTTKDATAFNNLEAYLLYVRGERASTYSSGTGSSATTLRPKGLLKQGSYTVPVAFDKSHTLIGNPYASPLDFESVYSANANNIQHYFWVWQASYGTATGSYLLVQPAGSPAPAGYYEYLPAPFNNGGNAALENRYIHSGQGFFVEPSAGASTGNSITISETHKTSGTPGISVFRTKDLDRTAVAPAKLYVNFNSITNNQKLLLDGVLARYDATYTLGSDNIAKAINSGENVSIPYNNTDLIVYSSPLPKAGDVLQLRMWNVTAKSYQLEVKSQNFATFGTTAVLEDKYLGTQTPLLLSNAITAYDFTVTADAASKDPLRFRIVFGVSLSPLPLHFTSVRAQEENSGIGVAWTVENEIGIKSYQVEKSTDGMGFKRINTTTAAGATSSQRYEILDEAPAKMNYYRIKLIGTAGEVKYSQIVKVEVGAAGEKISVYPNPITGTMLGIQLQNKPKGNYTLTLYSTVGQRVVQQNLQHQGGSASEILQLDTSLSAGYYILEVKDSNGKKERLNVTILR